MGADVGKESLLLLRASLEVLLRMNVINRSMDAKPESSIGQNLRRLLSKDGIYKFADFMKVQTLKHVTELNIMT